MELGPPKIGCRWVESRFLRLPSKTDATSPWCLKVFNSTELSKDCFWLDIEKWFRELLNEIYSNFYFYVKFLGRFHESTIFSRNRVCLQFIYSYMCTLGDTGFFRLQGIVKSTVFGVFEDLKFKISGGSDQLKFYCLCLVG